MNIEKPNFAEELIFLDPPLLPRDRRSIITFLCEQLTEKEFITDSYVNEVLKREELHPTGLPTQPYGCAVPHANPVGVHKTGCALAVLKKPVTFCAMDDPDKELDVSLIFLMAFPDGNQVAMLQWISTIVSDQVVVKRIVNSNSANQVFSILKPYLETK